MVKNFVFGLCLSIGTVSGVFAQGVSNGNLEPMPPQMENISDDKLLQDAYGFLIGGDNSWSSARGYEISDCVVNYTVFYMGSIRLDVSHFLNKVIWQSQRLDINNEGQTVVRFACAETCLSQQAYTEDESLSDILPVFDDRTERELTFLLQVEMDRFNAALNDVVSQCPGAESRY